MSNLSGNAINAIIWSADSVAIAFTAGRLYIRGKVAKKFYCDDAVQVLAMLCMIIQSAMYSGGRLLGESVHAYLTKQTNVVPNLTLFLQLNIASTVVTFTCYWAVKLSIMLFYRRLFWASDNFMKAWWFVLSFVFATYMVVVVTALVQCNGNGLKITDVAACSSVESARLDAKIFKISFVMNITSDLAIMALPMGIVLRLHIRIMQKIGVAAIFYLTFIIIAMEIVRLIKSLEGTGTNLNIVWASTEASIAVIISCLPTFNILLHHRAKIGNIEAPSYIEPTVPKNINNDKSARGLVDDSSTRFPNDYAEDFQLEQFSARSNL